MKHHSQERIQPEKKETAELGATIALPPDAKSAQTVPQSREHSLEGLLD